jgi:hypothetical protein
MKMSILLLLIGAGLISYGNLTHYIIGKWGLPELARVFSRLDSPPISYDNTLDLGCLPWGRATRTTCDLKELLLALPSEIRV